MLRNRAKVPRDIACKRGETPAGARGNLATMVIAASHGCRTPM